MFGPEIVRRTAAARIASLAIPNAATLVDWEFHTIDGHDVARISVDPSDHPLYEAKGDQQTFWWRTPVSTDAIDDESDRDRIIAGRWIS